MKESTSMIHEAQAKLKVTCSGGNDTPLWTFWLELLSSLPQLKTQPHAASIPALRFFPTRPPSFSFTKLPPLRGAPDLLAAKVSSSSYQNQTPSPQGSISLAIELFKATCSHSVRRSFISAAHTGHCTELVPAPRARPLPLHEGGQGMDAQSQGRERRKCCARDLVTLDT